MISKDRDLLVKFLCKFITETRFSAYTPEILAAGWSGRYPFDANTLLSRIAAWRSVTNGPQILSKIPLLIEIAREKGTVLDEEINVVMAGLIDPLPARNGLALQDMALNRSNACIVNHSKVIAHEVQKVIDKQDRQQAAELKRVELVLC